MYHTKSTQGKETQENRCQIDAREKRTPSQKRKFAQTPISDSTLKLV